MFHVEQWSFRMRPELLALSLLRLPLSDIKNIKRVVRTLSALGVYDLDTVVSQIVLGCMARREQAQVQRDEQARETWATRSRA
jgi:hypothetical protein